MYFVVLIVVLVLCVWSWGKMDYDNDAWLLVSIPATLAALLMVLMLLITRIESMAGLVEFDSVAQTVVTARTNDGISEFELAALQASVIEANMWLASAQYWGDGFFDPLYPDAIQDAEPIK